MSRSACWLLLPLVLCCLLLGGLLVLAGLSDEYLAGGDRWRRVGRHMGRRGRC